MKRIIARSYVSRDLSNIFCSDKLNPKSCVNIKSTGVSYYDDFLNPKDLKYMETNKNLTGYIEYMTPLKYYKECAKIFNSSVESLKRQRRHDESSIDTLTNAVESGQKFYLPYINYANAGQEGLHRMMVLADVFGWDDEEFPVLVVEFVDENLEIIEDANKELHNAVYEAKTYQYRESSLVEDFISQVQWELDRSSEYSDTKYDAILLKNDEDKLIVSIEGFEKGVEEKVYLDELRIKDDLEDDEINIDDLDLEDLGLDFDDFDSLEKYLNSR